MYSLFQRLCLLCFIFSFIQTNVHAQYAVNTGATAMQMAQELVGPGIEIISATYVGNALSKGIFSANNTTLPMDKGVVLSSGFTNSIGNPAWLQASGASGTGGDADLNTILTGVTTRDAAYLEFQFRAVGTEINFEFVFGSEEYPEYNCTDFNDVFGFFISGPGITGKKNLALVPGTDIPVTINSINNGNNGSEGGSWSNCTGMGPGSPFTAYYINNSGSSTIIFDGLTKTLVAHQEIQTCEIYTLKLAIADASDNAYDSGVFIKSNSFETQVASVDIFSDPVFPTCPTDEAVFTAVVTNGSEPITYNWFKNGQIVATGNPVTISNLEEGDVIICLTSMIANCSGTQVKSNKIVVQFLPYTYETLNVDICEGESYTFNGVTYTTPTNTPTDTIPDPPGCPKIVTLNLTLTPSIQTTMPDFGPFCQGETPPALPGVSTNIPPLTGTWSPATINTSTPGTTAYTFTPDAGVCALPVTIDITVNAPIEPVFDPIDPQCQNSTPVILPNTSNDSPPITGTWNPPTINTSTPGTFTFIFTPDAGACALPTSIDITVEAPVTPTFDTPGPLCQNDGAPPLPGASNDSPPINGTWSPATINTSTPGTFTYTFTPNADECALPTTIDVVVEPEVEPTFDQLGPYCKGDTPDILPGSSTNSPVVTGTWNPATINTSTPGTFTYIFTPDADICAASVTMEITIEAPTIPTFDQLGPYCKDDTPDILSGSSTNSPAVTGTWSPATINTSTPGTFTYTFTPDPGQCADPAIMEIVIEAPTIPSFDPIDPLCLNSTPIVLPNTSTNSPAITGTWSPLPVSTFPAGTTTYTFTPDPGQCALPTSIDIMVKDPVMTTFAAMGPFCQYSTPPPLPLNSSNSPAISGSWDPSTINTSTPGIFTYTFTPDPDECATPFTFDIEIIPEVIPVFTQLGPYCLFDTPDILNNQSENDPPIAGSWSPAVINTSSPGTATYTFTPDDGFCSPVITMDIEVTKPHAPIFGSIDPICQNMPAPDLPLVSSDDPPVTGTWNPAVINTSVTGTTTYTFTSDPGQCYTPISLPVTIYTPPPPTFTQLGPFCINAPAVTLPAISNDNPPVTGTWNPAVVNTSSTGTFTYTFTPDPGQCASATTMNIIITQPVQPLFDQLGPYCEGTIPEALPGLSNNNPPIAGSWDPPFINTSIAGPSSYTFTPNSNECASPYTMTVDILPLPAITITPVEPLCKDSAAITLEATPAGGAWSGTYISGNVFDPLSVGQFTVLYTYTDAESCTNVASIDITVNDCSCQDPASVDAGPDGSICIGGTYDVSGQIWVATASNWTTSGSGTFGNSSSLVTTYTPSAADIAAGSVILTLTTQDHDGNGPCSPVSDQMILNITDTPVNIFPVSPVCENNQSFELNASPANGIWSGQGVLGNYFDPSSAGPGTHTVTYALTGGCTGSASIDITVYPSPVVSMEPVGTLCMDDPAVSLIGTPAGGTFFGNGVTGNVFTPSVPGTFTIDYLYTDSNLCSTTASIQITVVNCNCVNPPTANAGPDLMICPTGSQAISGTVTNANTYIWTTNGTGVIGNANSLNTTYTPSAADVANGSVTLTLTALDPDGDGPCVAVSDDVIFTFETIDIEITPVDPMCINASPVTLNALPAGGIFSGTGVSGGVFNPSAAGAGNHTITYSINGNCPASESITVTVNPLPVISIQPVPDLCINDPLVTLTASPAGGVFTGPNVSGNQFTPVSAGSFTIIYTYTNANGCTSSQSLVIKVTDCDCDNPASADAGPDAVVCSGSDYTLSGIITVAASATWATSGSGSFSNANQLNATYTPGQADIDAGSVVLTLTTDDPDGDGPCSPVSDDLTLTFEDLDITLAGQAALCVDAGPVTLSATPAGGAWSGPGITGNSFDPSVAGAGTHTVIYNVNGNCPGSESMFIVVHPLPVIAITPPGTLCIDDPALTLIATPAGGTWSGAHVSGNEFTPSASGTFTLTYTYINADGCDAQQTVDVTVEDCDCPNPVAVDAGANISICSGEDVTINATITNASSITWTTSGDGSFDNINANPAVYTPGANDIQTGNVSIQVITEDPDGDGPCNPASDIIVITIDKTVISLTQVNPVCVDGGVIALSATPAGGTFSGNGVTGNTFDPAQAGAGSHTINYHVDGNCPADKTMTIIVNPLPVPVISPVVPLCVDDAPVTLTATPSGGSFTGAQVSGNIFTPAVPGTFDITYHVSNANGCGGSTTIQITVNDCGCDNPATVNAGNDISTCAGETIQLSGSITDATGGGWASSGDGNFNDPTLTNATYTPGPNDILNGSVVLTLTTDDPDGDGPCHAVSDAVNISINEIIINIVPVPDICIDGDPVNLNATPAGGIFSGNGVTGNTFNPALAGAGQHIITYTVAGNCPGSKQITVNVVPLPAISITPVADLCIDDPAVTLTAVPSGGTFSGDGITGNTFTPTQAGNFTITYTYTNPNGCTNTSTIVIQVNDCGCANPASAEAGANVTICAGETVSLSGSVTNAPSGTWSTNGTGTFTNANDLETTYIPSASDISKGKVIITLTTTDPDGSGPCHTFSDQLSITIIAIPNVHINTQPLELCLDDNVLNLSASPSGGQWTGPGITGNGFNPGMAGQGDHKLYYTYQSGSCTGKDSVTITVKDCGCNILVTVDAGPDVHICQDGRIALNGSISGSTDVIWTTSGSGSFVNQNAAVTEYIPSALDRINQVITLTLTSPDPDGDGPCTAKSDQMTVRITTLINVNLQIDHTDCQEATGSVTVLPPASDMFIFSVDNGGTFTDLPVFDELQPGDYTLIYKEPISGCQSSTDFTINPPPFVDASWKLTSKACTDAVTNYIDVISTENMTYPVDIYVDGQYQLSASTFPVKVDNLETGEHTLKIRDDKGCEVSDHFTITETSNIDIDIQGVYVVNEGEGVVLVPEISSPYTSIVWSPADYLSCTTCPTPTTRPEEEIVYTVEVTNEQGCKDEIDVRVIIRKDIDIFVPNVFTPNGDGTNDFVTVFTDQHIKIIDNFKIFTRWGELVFEKSDFLPNIESEGWNGKFRGQEMNPAVFAWVATVNIPGEGIRIIKGNVTLIR